MFRPVVNNLASRVAAIVFTTAALIVAAPQPALGQSSGHLYHVAKSGNDSTGNGSAAAPWLTVGKCIAVAVAGDTCQIDDSGFYAEWPAFLHSGTEGNVITVTKAPNTTPKIYGFQMNGKSYITVRGVNENDKLEITDPSLTYTSAFLVSVGTTHATFQHLWVHEVGRAQCFKGPSVNTGNPDYITLDDVTIEYCAARKPTTLGGTCVPGSGCGNGAAAISIGGNHQILQNLDISHVTDGIWPNGGWVTVRNVWFHDVCGPTSAGGLDSTGTHQLCVPDLVDSTDPLHVDFFQPTADCSKAAQLPTHDLLIENVRETDIYGIAMSGGTRVANGHLGVWQDTGATGSATNCGMQHSIMRYSSVQRLSAMAELVGYASGSTVTYTFPRAIFYNNTMGDLYRFYDFATKPNDGSFTICRGSPDGAEVNELWFNATRNGGNWLTAAVLDPTTDYRTNHAFLDPRYCGGSDCTYGFPAVTSYGLPPDPTFTTGDPLFVSTTNLQLLLSSPAAHGGSPPTKVDAADTGSGTTLNVLNSDFFSSGQDGTVTPDCIAVGNPSNKACIVAISDRNTITLDTPISREAGDAVWLWKDSAGIVRLDPLFPDYRGAFAPVLKRHPRQLTSQ